MVRLLQVGLTVLAVFILSAIPEPLPDRDRPELVVPEVKVTIDPGHGGHDPGAVEHGVQEKDVVLAISLKIKELAEAYPALEVVLTRETDRYIPLQERLAIAERTNSDAYVSVHANSLAEPDPTVSGVETILDRTRSRHDASWRLAQSLQEALIDGTGANDRGIKQQPLYTRHTDLPVALIEVGFLTSPEERMKLTDPNYQRRIAGYVIEGLLDYFK